MCDFGSVRAFRAIYALLRQADQLQTHADLLVGRPWLAPVRVESSLLAVLLTATTQSRRCNRKQATCS